ncbi:MAG: DUF2169 domain-containing protein [Candidatus Thiodiazotropha sp. (ex Rostrolucina anterorostrata)]|nr:DUF2169 domain-containing protein [Candidatus Thiodiazotropha sp. (ex Rostrolucina anterorostrata)]
MEVVVAGKQLAADAIVALDVSGQEHLVMVAKATWSIPPPGGRPRPLSPQPLESSDVYVGEPGQSAMLYGSDFARFKPRCDVLFNACAHAPNGQPVREMQVGWQVGPLIKGLNVVGPRGWGKRLGVFNLGKPQPFTRIPLHFGHAFGGTRYYEKGRGTHKQTFADTLLTNPNGIGWFGTHTPEAIEGAPIANLEDPRNPIRKPDGNHPPIAFSAAARHWEPRKHYAGTYDETWRNEVFPLLPKDFDEQFHQCAPQDQQMDYPKGGEPVTLRHMMAGRDDVRFRLPVLDAVKFRVLRTDYTSEMPTPVVDTLYFEPDEERFSAVWRASVPIKRRIQEFDTIAIGPVDPDWWEALKRGEVGGCLGCSEKDTGQKEETDALA